MTRIKCKARSLRKVKLITRLFVYNVTWRCFLGCLVGLYASHISRNQSVAFLVALWDYMPRTFQGIKALHFWLPCGIARLLSHTPYQYTSLLSRALAGTLFFSILVSFFSEFWINYRIHVQNYKIMRK